MQFDPQAVSVFQSNDVITMGCARKAYYILNMYTYPLVCGWQIRLFRPENNEETQNCRVSSLRIIREYQAKYAKANKNCISIFLRRAASSLMLITHSHQALIIQIK